MRGIQKEPGFELQVIVTGMHLSPEFGLTYREIEKDGFYINKKIEMLLSADTPSAITKSTSLGLSGFADAYNDLNPDLIIVLGDRFEVFAASIAALYARIPIAHIHGGETTSGAFDEAIRHSITKMAWWHFVATEEYKRRVIQLGEKPERVHLVGGMGVDAINKTKLLTKPELENAIGFKLAQKNLMVTHHPVTLENETSQKHFECLLNCIGELEDTKIILTFTNSDTNGRIINKKIQEFVDCCPARRKAYHSLGTLNYLSAMQFVDCIIGNSSSGLLEAPSFKIGTINIGDRQKGRLKAISVIDCNPTEQSIRAALVRLYTKEFQDSLAAVKNPYGEGGASERIIKILKTEEVPKEIKKQFFDL